MLCALAHSFPPFVAEVLERGLQLKRQFREETITDLLMASMVGLKQFGVSVEFPVESKTGGDMEWIFAAPKEHKGGRYLRLLLQAKRAYHQPTLSGGYWHYHHLDHGKGKQAQALLTEAAASPGTLPLYIFYHARSALSPANGNLPEIEGINLHEAAPVASAVKRGCKRAQKKIEIWRSGFMPLSEFLCWPIIFDFGPAPTGPQTPEFAIGRTPALTGVFHPDRVAARLREQRDRRLGVNWPDLGLPDILPANEIPSDIMRSIRGETTYEDRSLMQRPRVVLSTDIVRTDPAFKF
jgi:hypothetical protein